MSEGQLHISITRETGLLCVEQVNNEALELSREDCQQLRKALNEVDLSKVASKSEF